MILENCCYLISSFSCTSFFDVLQNMEHSSPDPGGHLGEKKPPWPSRAAPVAKEPSQGGNSPVNILTCRHRAARHRSRRRKMANPSHHSSQCERLWLSMTNS